MSALIDIYVKWDSYGWVATTPEGDGKSRHCSGPREAAEHLGQQLANKGTYKLMPVRRGYYKLVVREP